jgi:CRISPR-associated Csx2 family protein
MAKRLFVFLGGGNNRTGGYTETNYYLGREDNQYRTRFIGIALTRLVQDTFDTVHIIGTRNSMWDVFLEELIYQNIASESYDIDGAKKRLEDLRNIINDKGLRNGDPSLTEIQSQFQELTGIQAKCTIIEHGNTTAGIWSIFDIVNGLAQSQDDIYIDLTHGYRFIPMVMTAAMRFMETIKNVRIKGLFYGAFEMQKNGMTPILDMLPLWEMEEWTHAYADFRDLGSSLRLSRKIQNLPVNEDAPKNIQQYTSHTLNKFTFAMKNSRPADIIEHGKKLQSRIEQLKKSTMNQAYKYIAAPISETAQKLVNQPSEAKLLLDLSQRHFEKDQFLLAYLTLWEAYRNHYYIVNQWANRNESTPAINAGIDQLRKIRNQLVHILDVQPTVAGEKPFDEKIRNSDTFSGFCKAVSSYIEGKV